MLYMNSSSTCSESRYPLNPREINRVCSAISAYHDSIDDDVLQAVALLFGKPRYTYWWALPPQMRTDFCEIILRYRRDITPERCYFLYMKWYVVQEGKLEK